MTFPSRLEPCRLGGWAWGWVLNWRSSGADLEDGHAFLWPVLLSLALTLGVGG